MENSSKDHPDLGKKKSLDTLMIEMVEMVWDGDRNGAVNRVESSCVACCLCCRLYVAVEQKSF